MTVIELQHISKTFRALESGSRPAGNASGNLVAHTDDPQLSGGKFHALIDINLSVESGECLVIAGANGSGKSLLMHIIAGLEDPSSGSRVVRGRAGLVFQDADSQILGETPREDISISVRNFCRGKQQVFDRVSLALRAAGLQDKADFPARFLSGGEKRRLAVAGILALDSDIIIFDEPFANLDYTGVKTVNTLVCELKKAGKTILLLTHELEKCLGLATRFAVLHKGRIVFAGDPAAGLSAPLEEWGIHNPRKEGTALEDLVWK